MFGFAIIVFRGFSCSFKSRQSTWLKTLLGVSFFYFRRNEYFRVERHKNFGKEERERERDRGVSFSPRSADLFRSLLFVVITGEPPVVALIGNTPALVKSKLQ